MFEIGKTYKQTFANGDECYFTPHYRLKNGNWRGMAWDKPIGKKARKGKTAVVFDPPIPAWRETEYA
jgi:hypothetical protein